jgi:hypothetical protein
MSPQKVLFSFLLMVAFGAQMLGQSKTIAERLGYPADSKLLIIPRRRSGRGPLCRLGKL